MVSDQNQEPSTKLGEPARPAWRVDFGPRFAREFFKDPKEFFGKTQLIDELAAIINKEPFLIDHPLNKFSVRETLKDMGIRRIAKAASGSYATVMTFGPDGEILRVGMDEGAELKLLSEPCWLIIQPFFILEKDNYNIRTLFEISRADTASLEEQRKSFKHVRFIDLLAIGSGKLFFDRKPGNIGFLDQDIAVASDQAVLIDIEYRNRISPTIGSYTKSYNQIRHYYIEHYFEVLAKQSDPERTPFPNIANWVQGRTPPPIWFSNATFFEEEPFKGILEQIFDAKTYRELRQKTGVTLETVDSRENVIRKALLEMEYCLTGPSPDRDPNHLSSIMQLTKIVGPRVNDFYREEQARYVLNIRDEESLINKDMLENLRELLQNPREDLPQEAQRNNPERYTRDSILAMVVERYGLNRDILQKIIEEASKMDEADYEKREGIRRKRYELLLPEPDEPQKVLSWRETVMSAIAKFKGESRQ